MEIDKIIIDYLTSLDIKSIVIISFITIRLFPEVRQYLPDIWEVIHGRKKISDIRVKSGELKHFDKKQTFIATETISEADCDAFFLRLMRQINHASAHGESITFSFVRVRKISRGGIKGLKKMINTISLRDDCIVKMIFPKHDDAGVLNDVYEYAMKQSEGSNNMIEIKEDQRIDHDTEE